MSQPKPHRIEYGKRGAYRFGVCAYCGLVNLDNVATRKELSKPCQKSK